MRPRLAGLFWVVGVFLYAIPVAAQQTGVAVYYSDVLQGKRVASEERYDRDQLTAAYNRYPFGTRIRVTNLSNDKSVVVRINDRLPKRTKALIDLSRKAAEEIEMLRAGRARVLVEKAD